MNAYSGFNGLSNWIDYWTHNCYFIWQFFSQIPIIGSYIPIIISLALGYLGMSVGAKKKDDLLSIFHYLSLEPRKNL